MSDSDVGTEQTCPNCGLSEAAGWYCSRCLTRTGYDHWHKRERTDAQRAALERSRLKRSSRGTLWGGIA